MERPELAFAPTHGLEDPNAHLQSLPAWRQTGSPQAGTASDALLVSKVSRRSAGDAGQPWQEERRRGWGRQPHPTPAVQACRGSVCAPEASTGPSGLDPQTRQSRAEAARNPDDAKQSRTDPCAAGTGTRMGSSLRAKLLRVPTRKIGPRCTRCGLSCDKAQVQVLLGR